MDSEGRWIILDNGIHIFIKPGQSTKEAINEFTDKQEQKKALQDKTSTELKEDLISAEQNPKETKGDYSSITKKEWDEWYEAIGHIKRSMWCPTINGKHYIQINSKIFVTSGTYEKPTLTGILEFDNIDYALGYIERMNKW